MQEISPSLRMLKEFLLQAPARTGALLFQQDTSLEEKVLQILKKEDIWG